MDIALGALLGVLWGVYGFMSNRRSNPDEAIDPVKFGSTILVFGIAGAVIASRGEAVTYDELDALVIILAPIVDDMVNTYMNNKGPQHTTTEVEQDDEPSQQEEFTPRRERRTRRRDR